MNLAADFGPGELPPYGEVLRGAFEGDPALSVRGDTVEDSWRIVEPVLEAWRAGAVPLQEYPAGSHGPGDSLLTRRPAKCVVTEDDLGRRSFGRPEAPFTWRPGLSTCRGGC